VKDSFYEELEHVFDKFPKYHINILLGDSNAKVGKEDIFKPLGMRVYTKSVMTVELRVVNFATSKNLTGKSTMYRHRNIHKSTWTSQEGKPHHQIDHVLIDGRRHSSVLVVQLFRAADCDTDHPLAVAKVREELAVNKQGSHRFQTEMFNSRS
jgi:hypothetical protein